MTPPPEQPQALRSISDLFKDTWALYLGRVGVLMGLYLLSLVMLFIPPAVLVLAGGVMSLPFPELRLPLLVAGGLTGGVLGSVAMLWGFAGMIAAVVDRSLDFQTALRRGWERLWGFAWVTGLCAYVVIGGFFLFIVPGLLFLAWSFFAQFIFFVENRSGMDALMRSRCYVRRRLGEVLLRLLAVWGVSLLLGAIPMVGGLLSLLFYPFLLIYSFLLYRDLRSTADLSDLRTAENGKLLWLVLATLGYLLLPGVLLIAWGGTIVAQLISLLHP